MSIFTKKDKDNGQSAQNARIKTQTGFVDNTNVIVNMLGVTGAQEFFSKECTQHRATNYAKLNRSGALTYNPYTN